MNKPPGAYLMIYGVHESIQDPNIRFSIQLAAVSTILKTYSGDNNGRNDKNLQLWVYETEAKCHFHFQQIQ